MYNHLEIGLRSTSCRSVTTFAKRWSHWLCFFYYFCVRFRIWNWHWIGAHSHRLRHIQHFTHSQRWANAQLFFPASTYRRILFSKLKIWQSVRFGMRRIGRQKRNVEWRNGRSSGSDGRWRSYSQVDRRYTIKSQVEHLVNVFLVSAENKIGLSSIHRSWNHRLFIAISVRVLLFGAATSLWQSIERLLVQCSDWDTGAGHPLLCPTLLQHLLLHRDTRRHRPGSLQTDTWILDSFSADPAIFAHHFKVGFRVATLLQSRSQFLGERRSSFGPPSLHYRSPLPNARRFVYRQRSLPFGTARIG